MTLEPAETVSRADLDAYAAILAQVSDEAYAEPEAIRVVPAREHRPPARPEPMDDPERWALTWRAWVRKGGRTAAGART